MIKHHYKQDIDFFIDLSNVDCCPIHDEIRRKVSLHNEITNFPLTLIVSTIYFGLVIFYCSYCQQNHSPKILLKNLMIANASIIATCILLIFHCGLTCRCYRTKSVDDLKANDIPKKCEQRLSVERQFSLENCSLNLTSPFRGWHCRQSH